MPRRTRIDCNRCRTAATFRPSGTAAPAPAWSGQDRPCCGTSTILEYMTTDGTYRLAWCRHQHRARSQPPMHHHVTIDIDAPPEDVWAVVAEPGEFPPGTPGSPRSRGRPARPGSGRSSRSRLPRTPGKPSRSRWRGWTRRRRWCSRGPARQRRRGQAGQARHRRGVGTGRRQPRRWLLRLQEGPAWKVRQLRPIGDGGARVGEVEHNARNNRMRAT